MFKDGTARGCGRIVGDVIANAFIVPKFTGKLQLLVVNPVAKKTLVVLDRIAKKTKEALRPLVLAGMLAIDIERATPEELMAACRTFERNFKEYAMYAEKIAGKSCSEKQLLASMGGINQAIGEGINAFDAAANNVAKTEGLGLQTVDKVIDRMPNSKQATTILNDMSQYSGDLVKVPKLDPQAEKLLAQRFKDGQTSMKFKNDPNGKEFDIITKDFIVEVKPALSTLGSPFRKQAKRAFEAAKQTDRKVYFHFDGEPCGAVIKKLEQYQNRYRIEMIIDTMPLD